MRYREDIKLSEEDKRKLRELEAEIQWARRQIERLKAIGVDVSDLETELEKWEKIRQGLLREF